MLEIVEFIEELVISTDKSSLVSQSLVECLSNQQIKDLCFVITQIDSKYGK